MSAKRVDQIDPSTDLFEEVCIFVVRRSFCSLRQVATFRHGHIAGSFAPAFRAIGVGEHIWSFSRLDIWATLLSPKWAEISVVQIAGNETSLLRVSMYPREMGKQWVRDVPVVATLEPRQRE